MMFATVHTHRPAPRQEGPNVRLTGGSPPPCYVGDCPIATEQSPIHEETNQITRLRCQGEQYFADGLRDIGSDLRLAILAVCAIEWHTALHRRQAHHRNRYTRTPQPRTWRLQRLYLDERNRLDHGKTLSVGCRPYPQLMGWMPSPETASQCAMVGLLKLPKKEGIHERRYHHRY